MAGRSRCAGTAVVTALAGDRCDPAPGHNRCSRTSASQSRRVRSGCQASAARVARSVELPTGPVAGRIRFEERDEIPAGNSVPGSRRRRRVPPLAVARPRPSNWRHRNAQEERLPVFGSRLDAGGAVHRICGAVGPGILPGHIAEYVAVHVDVLRAAGRVERDRIGAVGADRVGDCCLDVGIRALGGIPADLLRNDAGTRPGPRNRRRSGRRDAATDRIPPSMTRPTANTTTVRTRPTNTIICPRGDDRCEPTT